MNKFSLALSVCAALFSASQAANDDKNMENLGSISVVSKTGGGLRA